MVSPRKGGGISTYVSLIVLYATAGRHLLFRLPRIPSLLLETRQRTSTGRTLNEKRLVDEPMIDDEHGRNDFIVHFDDILSGNQESNNHTSAEHFAALILKADRAGPRVYCRRSQMKFLSRGKYFVQMLRQGLKLKQYPTRPIANAIPILIKHDDSNGCYPVTHSDKYGFPRLSWSIPASMAIDTPKSSQEEEGSSSSSTWCDAISMPSYKMWKDVNQNKEGIPSSRMNTTDTLYPWSEKIPKAVWRGSTTCNNGMYGHLPLSEIPRSRLVKSSLERPDLIDAGFHKLVGKYAKVALRSILKEPIPLSEMMKYKAIIDIDGNNWSARFPSLLCTNSIIIKITPDFVDQYAHELVPNVHYVPSSLDNLTQVVEYILDSENDGIMREIVKKANKWCQLNLRRKESFAIKAMHALEMYRDSLKRYGVVSWENPVFDDMVECDV